MKINRKVFDLKDIEKRETKINFFYKIVYLCQHPVIVDRMFIQIDKLKNRSDINFTHLVFISA